VSERRQSAQRMTTEQVPAVRMLCPTPRQRPDRRADGQSYEYPLMIALHDIALRAANACAMVTPSAYSKSPPTGSPRAMRDTVNAYGTNRRCT